VSPPPSPLGEASSIAKNEPRANLTAPDAEGLRFRQVQFASRGDRLYLLAENNALHLWDLEPSADGYQAREIRIATALPEGITCIALRPDGGLLALGDLAGTVSFFDTQRRVVTGRIPRATQEGFVPALAFSPDGRSLAVGTAQGQILIWPATRPEGRGPRLSLPGHRGMITILRFDQQGRRLASAGRTDPLVEVWDLESIRRELIDLKLSD
jgi:WD40 repeat protein